MSHTVVVLGGYGVFGSRIAASLARHSELELIVAGRDAARASAFAATLGPRPIRSLAIDITDTAQVRALLAQRLAVVIDTAGPFQDRNLDVAESRPNMLSRVEATSPMNTADSHGASTRSKRFCTGRGSVSHASSPSSRRNGPGAT